MSKVPTREARLAHAARHAELWNAGRQDEWVDSWHTIIPAGVRLYDPVGTEEKTGFAAATTHAWDLFQHLLRITMVTVQVNGNEMAWVCENRFGTGDDIVTVHSIETFAWDLDGNLLIQTYYPMPEHIGADSDPYAQILHQQPTANCSRPRGPRDRSTLASAM